MELSLGFGHSREHTTWALFLHLVVASIIPFFFFFFWMVGKLP